MGLDQYGKARNPKTGEVVEIAYWRKHNALHGWMQKLWNDRGRPNAHREGTSFNCIPLELNVEDLRNLAADFVLQSLPKTDGLFFGYDTSFSEHHDGEMLKFIREAKRYLDEGWQVAYDSWW